MQNESAYKNLISSIDINRHADTIEIFDIVSIHSDPLLQEFRADMELNNDIIERNLVKNNAYKEAVIMNLKKAIRPQSTLQEIVAEHQKSFGGSKLFYLNDSMDKMLVMAVKDSMEGKLKMVISRLNKVNEKAHRLNSKIKRENMDAFMKKTGHTDQKDKIINLINKTLKV